MIYAAYDWSILLLSTDAHCCMLDENANQYIWKDY